MAYVSKRSKEVMGLTKQLQAHMAYLDKGLYGVQHENLHLVKDLEETKSKKSSFDEPVPINEMVKVSEGSRGQPTYPLCLWNSLSSSSYMVHHPLFSQCIYCLSTHCFLLSTKIKEIPSFWKIHRVQTALLAMVKVLITYQIAKADKWEKLFTDGTSRQQVAFQDLIISMEEDELLSKCLNCLW